MALLACGQSIQVTGGGGGHAGPSKGQSRGRLCSETQVDWKSDSCGLVERVQMYKLQSNSDHQVWE